MADKNKNKEVNKKEEVSEAVSEEVSEAVSEAAPDYLESDGFTLVDLDDYDYSEEDEFFEEDDRPVPEEERPRRPFRLNLFAVIGILIVAALAAGIIILLNWNKGTLTTWDRDDDSTKFDVEVQDVIFSLNPAFLEGREDDGVTTILFLGNDPLSDDRTETGIAEQIGAMSGATVINASFPSSKIACENSVYSTSTQEGIDDAFNLYYVCSALNRQDFVAMENIAPFKNDPSLTAGLEALKSTDMDKVDILAIMYDAVDYLEGSPVDNANNDVDIQTYTGSLKASIQLIQEEYPYIRIVFLSPTFAFYVDEDEKFQSGAMTDLGNGTISTYWVRAIDVSSAAGISFIDNYYGSINGDNYLLFMRDAVHLNEAGRKQIAEHFVAKILNNEKGEFDVSGTNATKENQTDKQSDTQSEDTEDTEEGE